MACGGMIFIKNFKFQTKKSFHFILLPLIFFIGYYCSKNIKRQSEHPGLRPDTSSLVKMYMKFLLNFLSLHLIEHGSSLFL